jgi:hypothetical protein
MPVSTQTWVPYPTAENPIKWPDLSEWDSILIDNMILPIDGVPKYEHHLSADAKKPKGSDFYKLTSHGIKPGPVHITLKLWVDDIPQRLNQTATNVPVGGALATAFQDTASNTFFRKNYLEMYRQLIPRLINKSFSKRFAITVYHPALAVFGVTSLVFTKVTTPQPVGGLLFHAELEGIDGREVRGGLPPVSVVPRTIEGNPVSIVIPPSVQGGEQLAKAWGTLVNTPASRSGAP